MSISIDVLWKVKEIQADWIIANPQRVLQREKFEDTAMAIIELNFGALTKRQISKFMRYLDMDFYKEEPISGRFGLLFRGDTRNRIMSNDLEKLNELFLEIYWNENLDEAERLISELDGVSDGIVSCLLYLKNREKYNVFIPATAEGIKVAFPNISFVGSFKERFSEFNKLANRLKQRCNLKPQEMDVILTVLGEYGI